MPPIFCAFSFCFLFPSYGYYSLVLLLERQNVMDQLWIIFLATTYQQFNNFATELIRLIISVYFNK